MADKDEEKIKVGELENVDVFLEGDKKTQRNNISEENKSWYKKLTKINGIGKETAKDIGRIYNSVEELKEALKNDKVPLRNDQVEKLNLYLNN